MRHLISLQVSSVCKMAGFSCNRKLPNRKKYMAGIVVSGFPAFHCFASGNAKKGPARDQNLSGVQSMDMGSVYNFIPAVKVK